MLRTSFQKLLTTLHSHKQWKSVLLALHLKHVSGVLGLKWCNFDGVIYVLKIQLYCNNLSCVFIVCVWAFRHISDHSSSDSWLICKETLQSHHVKLHQLVHQSTSHIDEHDSVCTAAFPQNECDILFKNCYNLNVHSSTLYFVTRYILMYFCPSLIPHRPRR